MRETQSRRTGTSKRIRRAERSVRRGESTLDNSAKGSRILGECWSGEWSRRSAAGSTSALILARILGGAAPRRTLPFGPRPLA